MTRQRERFSKARADHAQRFFEELLVHTKSPYARERFTLAPFQRDEIVRPLFGSQVWAEDLGRWVRRYTLAWLEVARKNGKSEVLAGIALYLTGADDEEGAEVYGVAKDTDQAALVFDVARRMLELGGLGGPPRSGKPYTIYPTHKRIVYQKTGSYYRVIAADALGNLGQNPHGIVFDEVIAQPNAELWDALRTGYGTRAQPLMIAATTAGDDTTDFARQEHEFSLRVAEDPSLDPRRFVYVRGLPRDADWTDESRWGEANPALDIFLRRQVLRDELTSALNNPREERRFRMYRLNQWQSGGTSGWAGAEAWRDEGNAGMVPEEKLAGRPCWGGVMAASASDLASVCLVFANPEGPGVWARWRHFMPEDRAEDLERRTSGASAAWARGSLELTEGNELDIDAILAEVRGAAERYDLRELAYFTGNALGITQPIVAERLCEVVSVGSSSGGGALVDWERMLSRGEFNHGGDPVAGWQVAHVRVRESGGQSRIDVKASPENVYAVVAAELALRRYLVAKPPARSAYEDHGLVQA